MTSTVDDFFSPNRENKSVMKHFGLSPISTQELERQRLEFQHLKERLLRNPWYRSQYEKYGDDIFLALHNGAPLRRDVT